MSDTDTATARRWKLGVLAALLVVVAANAVLIRLALTHPDEVVESYETEAR